jgi:hypothetical protein
MGQALFDIDFLGISHNEQNYFHVFKVNGESFSLAKRRNSANLGGMGYLARVNRLANYSGSLAQFSAQRVLKKTPHPPRNVLR